MPFSHARELLAYWQKFPPEHELVAMLAQVYTTWRPQADATPEDHRRSLEARWKAGAMNAAQIVAAMGGKGGSVRMDGSLSPLN